MEYLLYVIAMFVHIVIYIEMVLMLVRAVLSWIMPDSEGGIIDLVYLATEPLISPVRALLERIPAVADMPFDLSFFVTVCILSLLGAFL